MTKEEAIEIIECGDISNRWGKDGEEVEKMAIKALKQEPCEDAISREAVLKIIDGWYEQNRDTDNIEDLIVLITYMDSVNPQKPNINEVLDKIRAEIDEQYDRVHPYDISCAEGLEMALNIVDKYIAEEDKA